MEKQMRMVRMVGLCGFLVACGGDDGAAPFESGVESGKSLGSVSDSELQQICKAAEAWVEKLLSEAELKSVFCKIAAFTGAAGSGADSDDELRSACRMIYDECLKAPAESSPSTSEPAMCEKPPANCTATVGEVEACLSDTGSAVRGAFASIPGCDSISRSNMNPPGPEEPEEPASCKTVDMKCPGLDLPTGPDLD